MKIRYFQWKLVFSKEKYGKISDCQTFSYSVKICLVLRLDHFALCVQGQRNGQRWNFFTFWKRLRIVNEGRIFFNEKLVYFKEKYGVI